MRMFIILGLVLLVFSTGSYSQYDTQKNRRYSAGSMLGVTLNWDNGYLVCDTIEWDSAMSYFGVNVSNDQSPLVSCKTLQNNGMSIYQLKKLSGMALGILVRKGYKIVALTQWKSTSTGLVLVPVPGFSNDFTVKSMLSDFMYEPISQAKISAPEKLADEYTIVLNFGSRGTIRFTGREDVIYTPEQIEGTTQGIPIRFRDGNGEGQTVRRMINLVYVVVPSNKKKAEIIKDLELGMDNLKLDLSYKIPQIVPVGCP